MIKPFRNAFEAIKKIFSGFSKKKRQEEEEAARIAAEEAAKKAAEEEAAKKAAEEAARKLEEEQARERAMKEAARRMAAEEEKAPAKKSSGKKNKNASKKKVAAAQASAARANVSQGEIAEQKKYDEEVKKRAERAAKRAKEDAEAAKEEKAGKKIDPVTGERIVVEELPEGALYLKKYMKIAKTADDIALSVTSIRKNPKAPKNVVILGRNGFGTKKVGEDFARSFYAMGLVSSDKIAKIGAKQLNKITLDKLKGLKGGCLIIENAGLVSSQKLVEVIKNSSPENNDFVILMTGEIDSIARFFEENEEIVNYFIYLIDIHRIKEKGMVSIAKGYIEEKGYTADDSVISRLKDSLKSMEEGNIDRFIETIDKIMVKCDDREKSNGDTGKKQLSTEDFM